MSARRPRGLALITTLYVAFVILLFGMTLATVAGFGYQMANGRAQSRRALEAAQAGLAETIYGLGQDRAFGTHAERTRGAVDDETAWAVDFDRASGAAWSVNNLRGRARVPGWRGQVVPPWSALVVSRATCADQQSATVEAIVQYASFPYAVAASGSVSSSAILSVGGIPSLDALVSSHDKPGSVYGGTSVESVGPAVVTGRVRSPGTISLAPGSAVTGGIEHKADVLPDLDIQTFSDRDFDGVTELAAGSTASLVSGPVYVAGDLTLSGAVLDNAYLFVDGGDLRSVGGLAGTGTIFVTGRASLEGSLNVVAGTGIAIFSVGDLTVQGGSFFQGVLYSHGAVAVHQGITVIGAVVAENANPAAATVSLSSGATVVAVPEFTQFASSWSDVGMRGSLLNGSQPLMTVRFWKEVR
jgi:Tfp pilus assembly protein PilX